MLGTPSYMSPEQAEGRLEAIGPTSDVYGLGATLYEILTGGPPFTGEDQGEILSRVRRGEFPSPRRVRPDCSPALDAICARAMALRPEDRYPSVGTLAVDVDHWLADEPISAFPESRPRRLLRRLRGHLA